MTQDLLVMGVCLLWFAFGYIYGYDKGVKK